MVKTARINTTSFSYSNIAKNWLVCKPWDLLTLVEGEWGQQYITLATPESIIWGVCDDRKTFSDENETKEKARVNYTPTAWDNTYKMEVSWSGTPKVGLFYKITNDQKIDLSSESPSVGQLMVQDVNDAYIEVRFVTSQGLAVPQYEDVRLSSVSAVTSPEFTGEYEFTLSNGSKVTGDFSDLFVDLDEYQKVDEKGIAEWYASLDSNGKVPLSQLPNIGGGINYKWGWDASTGTYPTAVPDNWDMYYCTVAGIVDGVAYRVWDRIIYDVDHNEWSRLPDNYGVQSVNGRTGIVVDVQDTTDRKNSIDLVTPSTDKYLSEKAVADLINPLIARIEELEQEQSQFEIVDLSSDLPSSMVAGTSYTITMADMTADTNIVIGNTNTNGNIVAIPGNGTLTIISSANETNPEINILTFKSRS